MVGRRGSVGTATRYWLGVSGFETRWRRDFLQTSRPALEPTQPPVQWVKGLFSGVKAAGAWRSPSTPHLAPRLKKELSYTSTYFPSVLSWQIRR